MPSHAAVVQASIESMSGMLAVARGLVEGWRRIDLEGLDRDTAAICAATLALSEDEGRTVRPALEGLLRQVDALAADIARR
jgi:hypothetical protein